MGYSDVQSSGQGTQKETMSLFRCSHFSYCVEVGGMWKQVVFPRNPSTNIQIEKPHLFHVVFLVNYNRIVMWELGSKGYIPKTDAWCEHVFTMRWPFLSFFLYPFVPFVFACFIFFPGNTQGHGVMYIWSWWTGGQSMTHLIWIIK
jgi:hypothetical protein